MFIAPRLARLALKFGPEEYFALMIFGLTIIASVSGKSLVKGLIAGFFGLLIGIIGLDPVTGYARFSFNIPDLKDIILILFPTRRIIQKVEWGQQ
jgi:putative tricarboxylic transport membrane protein